MGKESDFSLYTLTFLLNCILGVCVISFQKLIFKNPRSMGLIVTLITPIFHVEKQVQKE